MIRSDFVIRIVISSALAVCVHVVYRILLRCCLLFVEKLAMETNKKLLGQEDSDVSFQ